MNEKLVLKSRRGAFTLFIRKYISAVLNISRFESYFRVVVDCIIDSLFSNVATFLLMLSFGVLGKM